MNNTKKDIKEALIGGAIVLFFIWILCGCTWTVYRPPMKLNIPQTPPSQTTGAYQYYVIDEHSEIPDAYFETKDEAESYRKYFEDHHTYKIISMK